MKYQHLQAGEKLLLQLLLALDLGQDGVESAAGMGRLKGWLCRSLVVVALWGGRDTSSGMEEWGNDREEGVRGDGR